MQNQWSINLIWWVTAVELPAFAGLLLMVWRNRRDLETALDDIRHEFETGTGFLRENLAAFKLEVAKSYASIPYLKEVERRLTDHLIRIENKLSDGGGR